MNFNWINFFVLVFQHSSIWNENFLLVELHSNIIQYSISRSFFSYSVLKQSCYYCLNCIVFLHQTFFLPIFRILRKDKNNFINITRTHYFQFCFQTNCDRKIANYIWKWTDIINTTDNDKSKMANKDERRNVKTGKFNFKIKSADKIEISSRLDSRKCKQRMIVKSNMWWSIVMDTLYTVTISKFNYRISLLWRSWYLRNIMFIYIDFVIPFGQAKVCIWIRQNVSSGT